MIGLRKRIEIVERLVTRPGRLILVEADTAADADVQMAVEAVERRPTDRVLRIPRAAQGRASVSIYVPGLAHLLSRLDGHSKPLVKEAV